MNNLDYAETNFLKIIERPEYKEYVKNNPSYAENEIKHLIYVDKKIQELWYGHGQSIQTPDALKVAGWYHDCDRLFPERKVNTKEADVEEYKKLKGSHAENCTNIFEELLPNLPPKFVNDVKFLIKRHEIGGDRENGKLIEKTDEFTNKYNLNLAADILCEADGLAWFEVISPSYVKWAKPDRLKEKTKFSYKKLTDVGLKHLKKEKLPHKVREILSDYE